jgi:hypothetical protein
MLNYRAQGPARQRRLTVFFRALLAIPHLIVLGLLGYAIYFVTFLAWFAALFIGRNPFHNFVTGYLRWYARVTGYLYFLTDSYPPFSMELAPQYALDADIPEGSLSRLTVFFRLILAIPVLLFVSFLGFGLGLVSVVAWIVTLFRGTLPEPLHNGFHATIRFTLRTQAYLLLVQDPYPRGLFGDPVPLVTPTGNETATGTAVADAEGPPQFTSTLPMAPPPPPEDAAPGTSWPLAVHQGRSSDHRHRDRGGRHRAHRVHRGHCGHRSSAELHTGMVGPLCERHLDPQLRRCLCTTGPHGITTQLDRNWDRLLHDLLAADRRRERPPVPAGRTQRAPHSRPDRHCGGESDVHICRHST